MMDTFTWVGFDPSLSHFGWSLFRDAGAGLELYRAGVWETEKDPKLKRTKGTKQKPGMNADTASRIRYLGEELWKLVQVEAPVALFVESLAIPFGRTSMAVVQVLGRVRGLVDLAGAAMGVPVIEFNSMTLKKLITGKGDAEKSEVARRIMERFPQVRIFTDGRAVDDNVTDAIAVGFLGEQLEPVTEARRLRGEHDREKLEPVQRLAFVAKHGTSPVERVLAEKLPDRVMLRDIRPGEKLPPELRPPTLEQLEQFWKEDT